MTEAKKPEVKKATTEERLDSVENAVNALIMYVNTLEKWRHMDFKPPQKEGSNESTEPGETKKEDTGKEGDK
tara:strand:- start:10450 stop:10665 length:216 start_codon:yes stop_codon:yes gene_type:complete